MRRNALHFALIATALLTSCQSSRSWQEGCAAAYSGVRYYAEILPTVPFDGKVFFTADLPLSIVVDTLALPITSFAERKTPPGGYVIGCRWARKRSGS